MKYSNTVITICLVYFFYDLPTVICDKQKNSLFYYSYLGISCFTFFLFPHIHKHVINTAPTAEKEQVFGPHFEGSLFIATRHTHSPKIQAWILDNFKRLK